MTTGVREHLLALVLSARADVRAARCDLGATPPPLARVPDAQQVQQPGPTTQPVLRIVIATAATRRA